MVESYIVMPDTGHYHRLYVVYRLHVFDDITAMDVVITLMRHADAHATLLLLPLFPRCRVGGYALS